MLGSCAKSHLERRVIRCLSSKNVPIHGLSRSLFEEAIRWLICYLFLLLKNLTFADGFRSSTKLSELCMTLFVRSAIWSWMIASSMEEVLPISAVR